MEAVCGGCAHNSVRELLRSDLVYALLWLRGERWPGQRYPTVASTNTLTAGAERDFFSVFQYVADSGP